MHQRQSRVDGPSRRPLPGLSALRVRGGAGAGVLAALALGAAGLGLGVGGCAWSPGGWNVSDDTHVYYSTPDMPQTVSVIDWRTGETVWSSEIPVGQQLVVQFRDGTGADKDPNVPSTMRWGLLPMGNEYGRLQNVTLVPPVSGRRLHVDVRPAPELPPGVAATLPAGMGPAGAAPAGASPAGTTPSAPAATPVAPINPPPTFGEPTGGAPAPAPSAPAPSAPAPTPAGTPAPAGQAPAPTPIPQPAPAAPQQPPAPQPPAQQPPAPPIDLPPKR
jgi:hypothetical protein